MKFRSLLHYLPLTLLLFSSCMSSYVIKQEPITIKLTPKQSEIYTNPTLAKYLSANKNPAILIRVPDQATDISASSEVSMSSTYNTIEKTFIKNGYTVRDRAIFEKIINQNQALDYNQLQSVAKVDLLIELVGISPYKIETNRYYDKKGKEQVMPTKVILGYEVSFKIVELKDNQIGGSYTFYFAPCTNGCTYYYHPQTGATVQKYSSAYEANARTLIQPYEVAYTSDNWTDFIETATNTMINAMRNDK